MQPYQLIIAGKKVGTTSTYEVLNPADESVVGQCPIGTREHLDAAVAAARAAFPAWAAKTDEERATTLLAIADLIEKHHAELAELVTREQGKPQNGLGANLEIGGAAVWTRVTAGLSLPEEVILDDKSARIVIRRKPLGVVGSITPWNWPVAIAVWHMMPALRVGCTVVIKPSPFTPLATIRLIELMNLKLPPGVVNIVTGDAEIGTAMSVHGGIDKIVFTGSIPTGKKIMANAAGTLKRLTLELGGNDAGIILPGTDIDSLLEKLFWGCFINAGQTCAALKRLYVHKDQYEEVVSKFAKYLSTIPVGNGLDPKTLIGPIANRTQFDKVAALVEDARAAGARIVVGGRRPDGLGYFYPLTLIADATDEMRVVREEQFGPVIPVLKYDTIEEAIQRANALEVGLGGSIWSNDPESASVIASRLECGTAWVNQHGTLHPLAPFGGVKASGIGIEFNVDGLKEYTAIQVLNVAR